MAAGAVVTAKTLAEVAKIPAAAPKTLAATAKIPATTVKTLTEIAKIPSPVARQAAGSTPARFRPTPGRTLFCPMGGKCSWEAENIISAFKR